MINYKKGNWNEDKMKGYELMQTIKNIALTVAGTIVLAFGVAVFIVPFELITGGVSGLALIFEAAIPLELSVDVYVTILTWSLFFLGLFILGKDFALKTLISTIVYPIALSLFLRLSDPAVLDGFFYLGSMEHGDLHLLIAAVFGGVFVGAGCAITFLGGGSTGGVDILTFIICKIFKRAKSSVVIFIIDASIVVFGMFITKDLVITLLAVSSAFVAAFVIDYVFVGSSKAFVANIVSDKYEEISDHVIKTLDRTTTVIDAIGGYSRETKKIVMVTFTVRQYSELINIIYKTDKNAFVTISQAHEINGEGWTRE